MKERFLFWVLWLAGERLLDGAAIQQGDSVTFGRGKEVYEVAKVWITGGGGNNPRFSADLRGKRRYGGIPISRLKKVA